MAHIGFIGLGHMGFPMALNLLKAGHEVIGFDKAQEPMLQLKTHGGRVAQSLKQVSTNQDVVISMLQTGAQVASICLESENGLFHHMRSGTLYIDASTIDVDTSRSIHAAAQKAGVFMVDAPVSGGVAGAKSGSLTFMVGGKTPAYDKAKAILSAMGEHMVHMGEAGSGVAAKICNNMILGITMAGVSEAFLLAEKLGLSPQKLHEIVSQSSGNCWVMQQYVPVPDVLEQVPANEDYAPGFSSAMMLKDLHLAHESGEKTGFVSQLAEQAKRLYEAAQEDINALDFSAIYAFLKARSIHQ